MSLNKIKCFIKIIHDSLNINGYVIMRRLNGDYILKDLLHKYFKIISEPIDKSMFYSEVVVAQKIHTEI